MPIVKPMRLARMRWLKRIGIISGVLGIVRILWSALGHIGNAETFYDIVKDWPTIVQYLALTLAWPWTPLILCVLCLCAWVLLSKPLRRHQTQPDQGTSVYSHILKQTIAHTDKIIEEARQREVERRNIIKGLVDEAIRLIREDKITFTLYALQRAGVGMLHTEKEFLAACEMMVHRNQLDPLKGLSLPNGLTWLALIKFANERETHLYSGVAVYDCTQAYFTHHEVGPKGSATSAVIEEKYGHQPRSFKQVIEDRTIVLPPSPIKPLRIEALPINARTENMTQLGESMKGGAVFCGKCILSVHNPNPTEGITGIGFRLLSIEPPLRSAAGYRAMTEDHALRRIKFALDDIEGKILRGDQTAQIHILTATRKPFAEPRTLKNVTIKFEGEWPIESANEFTPSSEHVLTVEATGDGLRTTRTQFKISFSAQFEDDVFTLTKLPS